MQPVNPKVERPVKELKGFARAEVLAGAAKNVNVRFGSVRVCLLRCGDTRVESRSGRIQNFGGSVVDGYTFDAFGED